MTREEAIAILADKIKPCLTLTDWEVAIYMAIEALSAPTDGDLISRQDAIEAIASRDETDGTVKVFTGRQVNEILTALPSADRPTGKWINKDSSVLGITYECSNCGRDCVSAVSYDIKGNEWRYNYCPNCGAKIGGDTT